MKSKRLKYTLLIFLLSLILNSCFAISIDGKDVITFSKAWNDIRLLLLLKINLCKNQGSKISGVTGSYSIPWMIMCTDPDPDIFLWTKSVDYCKQVITFAECPKSPVWDDFYIRGILSQCDFTKIKMYNNKKPLEGNLIDTRIHNGMASQGPDTGCI
ncbi:MAG: hypothetical protein IT569_10370 [Leptospiraceae bacterium]|nr:hypothetical protein [Leptospiraceae bacterium]